MKKSVVDIYGRDLVVDDSKKKVMNFNNAKKAIKYSAPIVEDGVTTEFWTDYLVDGTVDDLEIKLKTWNNRVLFAYAQAVNFDSDKNDPSKEKWNEIVEYVKEHEDKFFTKAGDWKKSEIVIEDIPWLNKKRNA